MNKEEYEAKRKQYYPLRKSNPYFYTLKYLYNHQDEVKAKAKDRYIKKKQQEVSNI